MGVAELLGILTILKQGVGWVTTQAALARAKGDITDAQLDQIKAEAGVSDAAWDEAVAAARARVGQ